MDSDLKLKYDFLPNRTNPALVFDTMAKYVKGYDELGILIAEAAGLQSHFALQLEAIESSSIIGKFGNKVSSLSSVARAVFNSSISLFERLDATDETSTVEDVEGLAKVIEANLSSQLKDFAEIGPHVDRKRLAEVLLSFSSANENVMAGERLEVSSRFGDNTTTSNINTKWRFTGDPKEMFSGSVDHFRGSLSLMVKVQVNQGASVWTFYSIKNNLTFTARVMDDKWLSDIQEVRIRPISAKDVISAEVEYDIYDTGTVKEIKNAKILKIHDIRRYEVKQGGFEGF